MHATNSSLRKLTAMGLLVALSVLLIWQIHFPIFPAAPWMEYDPADIPIFIGTFLFGPAAGLLLTVVAAAIQAVTVSASAGPIGFLMHVFATGSFCLVAGNIYRTHKTHKGAILALAAGVAVMTVTMMIWNIIFTPIFMGAPREAVMAMLVPVILPFNLIKAGANAVVTLLLYKRISRLVKNPGGQGLTNQADSANIVTEK